MALGGQDRLAHFTTALDESVGRDLPQARVRGPARRGKAVPRGMV
jgi:hypothetical protein